MNINDIKQTAAEDFRDSFSETDEPWLDREDRRFVSESDMAPEEDYTVADADADESLFYAMLGYRR